MIHNDIEFRVNYKKLIHAILYVINKMDGSINKYHLMKIMFVADKYHMNKYMRPVTGDKYIKMDYGTVPSTILNIVNGDYLDYYLNEVGMETSPFKLQKEDDRKHSITSSLQEDKDYLSTSDIEALDKGVEEYGRLSFNEVRDKNHKEKCWQETPLNTQIPYESMLEDNQEAIDFLKKNSKFIVL